MEVFQSIRDERLVKCPECSASSLKRLIGRGAGIIFKGSGFYQTDYKKTSAPDAEKASKDGGEKGSGEKKPAAPASSEAGSSKPAANSSNND